MKNSSTPATHRSNQLHPLVALATAAVLITCLIVVAAVTDVLPTALSKTTPSQALPNSSAPNHLAQIMPAPVASDAQPPHTVQTNGPIQSVQPDTAQPVVSQSQPAVSCVLCGVVESVRVVQLPGHSTGVGALGGAVAGGVVGNQFGSGSGRTAMTLLGALGGGLAGNSVERNLNTHAIYKVRVRMENGYRQTFTYHYAPPYQPGHRVRVLHGSLSRIT
ncbi:glycine zipper 2TM domain-containing protein [Mycoavidus sp. B2-EB]|uniref:glycine zipper 2TM domain-containing protein n=1 Tax=Mycoavidus sp. B2-EB TaxID=2651972 RepID=UPI001624437E|nr:glycine zipper 2TM domain-containing protein [Mycoavidus sp. B2-EB]BBO59988.1 hypothetical protein MPB2EB_1122 [Mycoavidus sp. B2-EB]